MPQRMTALKTQRYGGHTVPRGAEFFADDRHVRVLVASRLAAVAPERKPEPQRRMPRAPEIEAAAPTVTGAVTGTVAGHPAQSSVVSEALQHPDPASKSRTYTRRDMKAST